jgi:hypothetical protein
VLFDQLLFFDTIRGGGGISGGRKKLARNLRGEMLDKILPAMTKKRACFTPHLNNYSTFVKSVEKFFITFKYLYSIIRK